MNPLSDFGDLTASVNEFMASDYWKNDLYYGYFPDFRIKTYLELGATIVLSAILIIIAIRLFNK